jgi:hypothetical protein
VQYSAFIYGSQYVSNEGDLILPHSTLQYFLLALAGVFVVTTFMLVRLEALPRYPWYQLLEACTFDLLGLLCMDSRQDAWHDKHGLTRVWKMPNCCAALMLPLLSHRSTLLPPC